MFLLRPSALPIALRQDERADISSGPSPLSSSIGGHGAGVKQRNIGVYVNVWFWHQHYAPSLLWLSSVCKGAARFVFPPPKVGVTKTEPY